MTRGKLVRELIKIALKEDIGTGDITTKIVLPEKIKATALIIAKEKGILAGIDVAKQVFHAVDKTLRFVPMKRDGEQLKPKTVIASIYGDASSILKAERTALNFLQHLSGIATLTNQFVQAVRKTKAKILDTRKTIPGMRILEKYAVKIGGGENHRLGLYDMILIKSNHIKACGGIAQAINRAKAGNRRGLGLEVEAKNLEEVKTALSLNVPMIMLDNMSISEMRKAVKLGKAKFEASGKINLKNVRQVAKTGVDYISVGALTHSAKALDISLKLIPK
uniref:Probable nicotinate-nucleotide pyrophosphorylase [carboxylating] n=1 Tax=candidate division WOR-3 bacterium TaxID=2052148 RepID=A0A7C6EHL1_UNCW3